MTNESTLKPGGTSCVSAFCGGAVLQAYAPAPVPDMVPEANPLNVGVPVSVSPVPGSDWLVWFLIVPVAEEREKLEEIEVERIGAGTCERDDSVRKRRPLVWLYLNEPVVRRSVLVVPISFGFPGRSSVIVWFDPVPVTPKLDDLVLRPNACADEFELPDAEGSKNFVVPAPGGISGETYPSPARRCSDWSGDGKA